MSENRWISVKERLPKNGVTVIAYSPRDGIEYKAYCQRFNNGKWDDIAWQRNGRCNMEGVTHWQPRLAPPTSGNTPSTGTKDAPQICPDCGCPIKEKLDSESCWCGVRVRAK